MKLFKRIVAGVAALSILTSCSILQGVGSAVSNGSSTGTALSAIYNVLKATGGIDLSNLANLINIGQILTGANSLANATASYTDEFTKGLIQGSNSLVTTANASKVISGLKSLAGMDTSAITTASSKAFAGTPTTVSTSDKNVDATMKAITSLLGSL
jgi:hypothetical protein